MIKVKNSTGPLALCMFFSGYCGIVAELSLFTLAESLIGGTYVNLLCTMGVMMFSMGLGSWLSGKSWAHRAGYGSFISLELSISALCASAIPILHTSTRSPVSPFIIPIHTPLSLLSPAP